MIESRAAGEHLPCQHHSQAAASRSNDAPQVEKPTVRMTFMVNTSPFAGREGKFVTSRNIKDRLDRELERNLALTVEPGETADQFIVSGRGALHISILIENMRREGFEFQVGPPRVRLSTPPSPVNGSIKTLHAEVSDREGLRGDVNLMHVGLAPQC